MVYGSITPYTCKVDSSTSRYRRHVGSTFIPRHVDEDSQMLGSTPSPTTKGKCGSSTEYEFSKPHSANATWNSDSTSLLLWPNAHHSMPALHRVLHVHGEFVIHSIRRASFHFPQASFISLTIMPSGIREANRTLKSPALRIHLPVLHSPNTWYHYYKKSPLKV